MSLFDKQLNRLKEACVHFLLFVHNSYVIFAKSPNAACLPAQKKGQQLPISQKSAMLTKFQPTC